MGEPDVHQVWQHDSHVFHLMVEPDHVYRTLSVEEAVAGTVTGSGK